MPNGEDLAAAYPQSEALAQLVHLSTVPEAYLPAGQTLRTLRLFASPCDYIPPFLTLETESGRNYVLIVPEGAEPICITWEEFRRAVGAGLVYPYDLTMNLHEFGLLTELFPRSGFAPIPLAWLVGRTPLPPAVEPPLTPHSPDLPPLLLPIVLTLLGLVLLLLLALILLRLLAPGAFKALIAPLRRPRRDPFTED